VFFPPGVYLTTSTLTVAQNGVQLYGMGRQTRILFAPTAEDVCLQFTKGASILFGGCLRDIGLYSDDAVFKKTAVLLNDVSAFTMNNVEIGGSVNNGADFWSGADSIGLHLKGRECSSIDGIQIAADRAVLISGNPNSVIDLDHFHFHDCYFLGNGHPIIEVETGCNLTQITFDGYQAWVLGEGGFKWVDTTSSVVSNGLTFQNVRTEQTQSVGSWMFDIQHNTGLQGLKFIGGQSDPDQEGFRLRKCESVTVDGHYFTGAAGRTAMDVAATVKGLSLVNCFWQAASSATMTGQQLIYRSPLNPNTGPLAPTALYDSTANTKRGFVLGDAISEALFTVANNGVAVLGDAGMTGLLIVTTSDGTVGMFQVMGAGETVKELSDVDTVFTVSAASPASTNVYWSAGNSQYELENKNGGSRNYKLMLVGSYAGI
jgi:hypothetical protein